MGKIPQEAAVFLLQQGFVIVSTVDKNGYPHCSCKDIIEIRDDVVYLFDLYHGNTLRNLKANPRLSLTTVDEHKFRGYCLKGMAKTISGEELDAEMIKAWEARISSRIAKRLLKNIGGYKGHESHPEILLPNPKYMIAAEIQEVINLTPPRL